MFGVDRLVRKTLLLVPIGMCHYVYVTSFFKKIDGRLSLNKKSIQ